MDRNQVLLAASRCMIIFIRSPYLTYSVGAVLRRFAERCIDSKQPARAILLLRTALQKLRPSPDHLTPIHPVFLMACLAAKYVLINNISV